MINFDIINIVVHENNNNYLKISNYITIFVIMEMNIFSWITILKLLKELFFMIFFVALKYLENNIFHW